MSAKYTFNSSLPAAGHRCKKDNEGLVLVHLTEQDVLYMTLEGPWQYYLAINPSEMTYNSELRRKSFVEGKGLVDFRTLVELTPAILDDVVANASDTEFMGINPDDVNDDFMVLDGIDTLVEIKANGKALKLEGNNLDSIACDGSFKAAGKVYKTKLHLILKRIYKLTENA